MSVYAFAHKYPPVLGCIHCTWERERVYTWTACAHTQTHIYTYLYIKSLQGWEHHRYRDPKVLPAQCKCQYFLQLRKWAETTEVSGSSRYQDLSIGPGELTTACGCWVPPAPHYMEAEMTNAPKHFDGYPLPLLCWCVIKGCLSFLL